MVRGPFFDEKGIKKGAWSEEEDERLKSYIQSYGHPNWRQLPKLAGLARCGKSCRLRWMNYLRPNLKHGNYTPEEEEIIMKLHQQHGNKWSLIAENLPGRTDNDVKNHWHSQLKRRLREGKQRNNCDQSNMKEKKASHHHNSESEIMKVVDEFNNILESSSLMCTEMSTSAEENSASLASIDLDQEDNNEQASRETNKFQDFRGDFWTEPFITENTFSEYCYDYQIGSSSSNSSRRHFFSYVGAEFLY